MAGGDSFGKFARASSDRCPQSATRIELPINFPNRERTHVVRAAFFHLSLRRILVRIVYPVNFRRSFATLFLLCIAACGVARAQNLPDQAQPQPQRRPTVILPEERAPQRVAAETDLYRV